MRILYIGQYTEGTTSKMRADALKRTIAPEVFEIIDTHVPFYKCHTFWRSLAFRYKIGKVIWKTNQYILDHLSGPYDVIWVDKAVFIKKSVTQQLKSKTQRLIHYTPDAAFKENQSRNFYNSLPLYDYAITTKSFEKSDYLAYLDAEKVIFIPQGFNKTVHYPRHKFDEKMPRVVFVGLFEPSRGDLIATLLKNKIPVALAGKNWQKFVAQHPNNLLTFLGEGLFSDAYASALSGSALGLGLVSKRFPELHTTRTFEIPACGTALLTEYNQEIAQFYTEDEVIYFKNEQELLNKIRYYLSHLEDLQQITTKGFNKVQAGGYDYQEQLAKICVRTGILTNL